MLEQKRWRNYEEVAQYLLAQMAGHFGLGKVEGKQLVAGASGTSWEIDAKGLRENYQGLVIIECRRHTTQGITQEQVAGLAFRIQDTGAVEGIIVSPLPLLSGARKVAISQHIQEVQLSADCTTTDYVLRFLERTFIGVSCEEKVGVSDHTEATVIRSSERGEVG